MKITVQSSKLVKPAYDGNNASCKSPFANADAVPLSVFDKANFDQHIPLLFFFRPPAPPGAVLEAGLAKALAEYREWAGRRGTDAPVIVLNDAGVRFVQATADAAAAPGAPRDPTPEMLCLLPTNSDDDEELLMMIQVTRFTSCGSFAVGLSFLHLVADGHAVFNFLGAWGQATRGVGIHPVPVHDRVSLFKPRDPPRVEFDHRGVEFKTRQDEKAGYTTRQQNVLHPENDDEVVVTMVHFTRDMISTLKSQQASTGAPPPSRRSYSTLQCVVAHLWRCITKARGLSGSQLITRVHIAVNGRRRIRSSCSPRVPDGYTGNVVLWARPAMSVDDLTRRPLRETVEAVSRAISGTDERYFRSFVDFASSGVVEELGLVPAADAAETVLSPDVEVDSLVGLPIHGADFGTGAPVFYMPGYLPVEGVVFLVPSLAGDDGGVYAYVALFSHAVNAFKQCCYSISRGGGGRVKIRA
ncbi:hypothetical protein QOZ80_9BG0716420 [Eleusine coracana subsp. coracana]|nr:hypothetical protein QOZ80_9BG0716420 [Eleusine coracana subsp. coracana]